MYKTIITLSSLIFSVLCIHTVLDASSTGDFTVKDAAGPDASTMLKGSGSSYEPIISLSNNTGKVVLQAVPEDGITGLKNFTFVTSGQVSITLEIYGPQDFKYLWQEVMKKTYLITILLSDKIKMSRGNSNNMQSSYTTSYL